MCCSKCEEKVQEELLELDGVYQVFCDQGSERVTVRGYADPFEALKKVKRVKRKSEFWNAGIRRLPTKLAHSTSFRSDYMRPRQLEESFYRSSPNRASYYRQQPSHSETYFFDNPCYESPRASYVRPLGPDSFGWPTFQYDRVPPYAQTYYTEDYPRSYTWYWEPGFYSLQFQSHDA